MQAILFNRGKFNVPAAQKWAHARGYRPIKYHVTPNYVRARLVQPDNSHYYRVINLANNIKAVASFPKKSGGRVKYPKRRRVNRRGGSLAVTAERLFRELLVPLILYGGVAGASYGIYKAANK